MLQVRVVVAALPAHPFVAGPAEVLHDGVGGVRDPVDLLPLGPAHVADPDLARPGADGEAEGIAQAVGDDPSGVGVRAAEERVGRQRRAGGGIDAQDRAVQTGRVARRAEVLGAQGAALGGRRRQRRAGRARADRRRGSAGRRPVRSRPSRSWRRPRRRRRAHRPGRTGALPIEWLGNCWHQPSMSTCSGPVIALPAARRRETRPLTTQPSVFGPGGVGQLSAVPFTVPQRGAGAGSPRMWS